MASGTTMYFDGERKREVWMKDATKGCWGFFFKNVPK